MNEDLDNIQYSPIRNYDYGQWFKDVQYNGKTLSDSERKELVTVLNETIDQYSNGLPWIQNVLNSIDGLTDEFHVVERTVVSIMLFVQITMIDSIVASKYFILSDMDYDRRFMRGKLFVILNEGFKKLYGFDTKTYRNSEWDRLLPLMRFFPKEINCQYQELTLHLEKQSKSFSWWRDERNSETHLLAEDLYKSRQVEIIESKVMMDSMKLFCSLDAVDHFLSDAYICINNFLIQKYRNGELKE